ncbi:MAG: ankyrin repeat domain-containing protein [Leptospiraceae bacterium]|nr:ankyrin repeat domain-containing protein [Leptospiraceae bacterium]MCP5502111.1 ankyrin repeat domain-containing protein [Leptospiraceae bacterium]
MSLKNLLLLLFCISISLPGLAQGKKNEEVLKKARLELIEGVKKGDLKQIENSLKNGAETGIKDKDGTPLLFLSSSLQSPLREKVIDLLLDNKMNLNETNQDRNSLLHLAVLNRDSKFIKYLLTKNIETNLKDRKGLSPLLLSITLREKEKIPEITKILVEAGVNLNLGDLDSRTALHYAAKDGNEELVRYLLNSKAEPDSKDVYDRTPLHEASYTGFLGIVQSLVEKKASINAKDINEKSPLILAAEYAPEEDGLQVMNYLINKGAEINAADRNGRTAMHALSLRTHLKGMDLLIKRKSGVNQQDKQKRSPLFLVTENLSEGAAVQTATLLLQSGAKPDLSNTEKNTALQVAVLRDFHQLVTLLLNSGANPNALDLNLSSALHLSRSHEVTKLLLDKGAKADARDKDGITPLHYAVNKQAGEMLLARGAKVDAKDSSDLYPHHFAALHGKADLLELLLQKGANKLIDSKDADGRTALMDASKNGHTEAVKILLKYKANVNLFDLESRSALHEAVTFNQTEIVELLLSAKSRLDMKDDYGKTPIQIARALRYSKIEELLKKFGAK